MYQTIVLAGNLGHDPEMRYTPTGKQVTNFSVATNRQYTNGGGEVVKETTWFHIQTWGKTAEICNQYLKKGAKVLVEGRLIGDANGNPRIWTGQDGSARASFEVNAQTVRFLSSGNHTESTEPAESEPASEPAPEPASAEADPIPF